MHKSINNFCKKFYTIKHYKYRTFFLLFIYVIGFSASFGYAAPATANISPRTFPSLPLAYRENRYKEIQTAFDERSKLYLQGRQFHSWKANKSDQEIAQEYADLESWRHHAWYSNSGEKMLISRPDFMVAQDLLEKGYYKRPHLLAFQYNQTDGSYNSSTIILNGQRFLAMEAPSTAKLTQNFFNLLQNHQVSQLVRLTPASENGVQKSIAYWQNRVKKDPKTGKQILQVPFAGSRQNYEISYYSIDNWLDHRGIDPKILLKTIQEVRKNYDPNVGLLACHCSGGVGRTGTFLAGFILLQDIDKQIALGATPETLDISIEKVVLQLSLQRIHMVARAEQYQTLYRLVDLYVQSLNKNKT